MATAAQINANRINAQKSTGPRTPEGKAVVAQNALKHGFWSQEVVIKGEDLQEFALHRAGILEELAPAGFMETLVVARVVSLSWRLQRAERLQVAAFEKVQHKDEPEPDLSPEDASWLLKQIVERGISLAHPSREPPKFGRKAVQDFNQERTLDRLLVYERRLEHSLYRTMAELRKLRKEGIGEGGKVRRVEVETILPAAVAGFSPAAVAPCPEGVSTNAPQAQEPLCETKPISLGETCETKPICEGIGVQGSGISDLTPDSRSLTPALSCETKPISPGEMRQTKPIGHGQTCETKPISEQRIKDGEGYIPVFRRRR